MNSMVPARKVAVRMPVQFQLVSPVTSEEVVGLLQAVSPLREENFHIGQRGSGAQFVPDYETISKLMLMGTIRWITASCEGRVIGVQQWAIVPHLWSRGLSLGICDSIIGGRRRGVDIHSFVKYGVAAMKAVGAHRIYYSAPVGSSFERVLESLGARRLDVVMEMP